jgi:hypothetical protein
MEENDSVPEPDSNDPCTCGHSRGKHTANQDCRDCKCDKFKQKYDPVDA